MIVLGLDPSTRTGYCKLGEAPQPLEFGTWDLGTKDRFKRWVVLEGKVIQILREGPPDLVVIEGYGYGNQFTLATLVELGTIIRRTVIVEKIPFIEVPPTLLKKFVTGSGNSKKNVMLKEVQKLWGFDTDDDNAADAYSLAKFGGVVLKGPSNLPAAQIKLTEPYCDKVQNISYS